MLTFIINDNEETKNSIFFNDDICQDFHYKIDNYDNISTKYLTYGLYNDIIYNTVELSKITKYLTQDYDIIYLPSLINDKNTDYFKITYDNSYIIKNGIKIEDCKKILRLTTDDIDFFFMVNKYE